MLKQYIQINDWERRSGKTVEAVHITKYEPTALLIVRTYQNKRFILNHEKDEKARSYLSEHIMTVSEFLDKPDRSITNQFRTVIIDEGLTLDFEANYNMIYKLGYLGLSARIYGSSHVYLDMMNRK